jgi:hypothetical protein
MPYQYHEVRSSSGGCRYFSVYVRETGEINHWRYFMLRSFSDRIWQEEDDSVRWLKNRWAPMGDQPVDMKEFFWVKLRSQTWQGQKL